MSGFVDRIASRLAYQDLDRRSFLQRFTMGAAALVMAPKVFALEPVSAYAAICSCSGQTCACGSLCCDGYTEFCCTLSGQNTCPSGTVPAGWWKADGAGVCDDASGAKPRYYLDCNIDDCGTCGCGSRGVCSGACQTDSNYICGCGNADCNNRKASCTQFRYGQCNADISCLGPIVCRVVTCTPPWLWDPSCTTASATDNNTRFHNRPCLTDPTVLPGGTPIVGDWTGEGKHSIGVFAAGTWTIRMPDETNRVFLFGQSGDIPLIGDWNGDGVDTVGVYRRGRWLLRNDNSAGEADFDFWYGDFGDTPLVGDWTGKGFDSPGIYRDGQWHLRNSNSQGNSDFDFFYGDPQDTPLVGDWTGDGVDTPAIYRLGQWHLRYTNTQGNSNVDWAYGDPYDMPVVGDWTGDGVMTAGIVRSGKWYLRYSNTTGIADEVL